MRVAMSVAIAVATHPAAGVDRRCVHPLVGGVDEASAELRRHHLRAEIHEVPSIMEDESTYVVVCNRIK